MIPTSAFNEGLLDRNSTYMTDGTYGSNNRRGFMV